MSRTAYFDDHGAAVELDCNSPARILARSEPMHPEDRDFDADLAPDDGGEDVDLAGIKNIPRDALALLVRWLIPPNAPGARKKWRVAQIRLALLAHLLDLDGIGSKSFEELGQELGCTRALLSLYSLRMIDGLAIDKTRNGKCRRSRDVYRQSATEAHRRQGHRMKQDVAQGV